MDDYTWTIGGSPDIHHYKLIAVGGYGEVHEMLNHRTGEHFARKVVRPFGDVSREDIENEARVIVQVLMHGPHPNIVSVLAHGSLSAPFYYYHVDMELCDFTLDSYIHDRQMDRLGAPLLQASAVPLALAGDFSVLRAANVLTILQHTSEGLSFLHRYRIVHRDLKPKNILYCHQSVLWKITDFGTSAEATSQKSLQTTLRRGTASYRAPEVLSDTASYTNKVDIWALGCIAFELASGQKAFSGDWDVRKHALDPSSKPPQLLSMWPKFMQSRFQYIIEWLLSVEYTKRPSSTQLTTGLAVLLDQLHSMDVVLSDEFPFYSKDVGILRCLTDWKAFVLEYPESRSLSSRFTLFFDQQPPGTDAVGGWWNLVNNYPLEPRLLEELQAAYNRYGDRSLSVSGWRKLYEIHPTLNGIRSHLEMACQQANDYGAFASILEEQLKETAVSSWETSFDLAEAFEKSEEWSKALKYWQQAENLWPFGPVLRISKVLDKIGSPKLAAETWKDTLLRQYVGALPGIIEENLHRAYRELGMLDVAVEGWAAIRNKHPYVRRFQGYVAVLKDAKSRDILSKMPIEDTETNADWTDTEAVSEESEADEELLNLEMLAKDSHNLELQAELADMYAYKGMEVEALVMWQKIIKRRPYRSGFKKKLIAGLETVKGDEGTKSRKEIMKKSRNRGIWEYLKGSRNRYGRKKEGQMAG